MKVNILVDFKEDGIDKNEPHIVIGSVSETAAGMMLKQALERKGYDIQSMIAVEGDYTLDQLYDMANYGTGLDKTKSRVIYLSEEAVRYFEYVRNNPEEAERVRKEIQERLNRK